MNDATEAAFMTLDDIAALPEEDRKEATKKRLNAQNPQPKTIDELRKTVQQFYQISDEDLELIDTVVVVACDRRIPGDPLWYYLIGPPGYLKTVLCRALRDVPEVYTLDGLTEKALISGKMRRNKKTGELEPEAGIYKYLNNKILVMKDFTLILSMREDQRQALLSQLRNAYDGYFEMAYGTNPEPIREEALFGFLGAVTPAFDNYTKALVTMGPRCLKMRIHKIDRLAAAKQARLNSGREEKIRLIMRRATANFIETTQFKNHEISLRWGNRIDALATYVAYMRSHVFAKYYKGKVVNIDLPSVEAPTRIAKQLTKTLQGLLNIRNHEKIENEDYETITRIAQDTAIPEYQKIMQCFFDKGLESSQSTYRISEHAELHFQTTENKCEIMAALKILKHDIDDDDNNKGWSIHPNFRKIIHAAAFPQLTTHRGKGS